MMLITKNIKKLITVSKNSELKKGKEMSKVLQLMMLVTYWKK